MPETLKSVIGHALSSGEGKAGELLYTEHKPPWGGLEAGNLGN